MARAEVLHLLFTFLDQQPPEDGGTTYARVAAAVPRAALPPHLRRYPLTPSTYELLAMAVLPRRCREQMGAVAGVELIAAVLPPPRARRPRK